MTTEAQRPGLLEGKVTIITGASSGIGAQAARLFAREGARLVLAARREDRLRELEDELSADGAEVEVVVTDVAVSADVKRMVAVALERFGRLDAAFNNAGVTFLGACKLADADEADVLRLTEINLVGVWRCLAAEIKAMRSNGGGAIVNNSSIGGFTAGPRLGPYSATKHGVIGLTRTASVDHASEAIRVNVICPGGTHSEMIDQWAVAEPTILDRMGTSNPQGRWAHPAEIAEAACWLLSDRASYVTGAVLPVDGGFSAH